MSSIGVMNNKQIVPTNKRLFVGDELHVQTDSCEQGVDNSDREQTEDQPNDLLKDACDLNDQNEMEAQFFKQLIGKYLMPDVSLDKDKVLGFFVIQ